MLVGRKCFYSPGRRSDAIACCTGKPSTTAFLISFPTANPPLFSAIASLPDDRTHNNIRDLGTTRQVVPCLGEGAPDGQGSERS